MWPYIDMVYRFCGKSNKKLQLQLINVTENIIYFLQLGLFLQVYVAYNVLNYACSRTI